MDVKDTNRQIGVVLWRVVSGRARVKTVRGAEKWASSRRLVGLNISGIAACRYIGPPYCGQSIIPIRRSNNNPRYKEEFSLPLNLGTIDSIACLSKHGSGKSELTKVSVLGPWIEPGSSGALPLSSGHYGYSWMGKRSERYALTWG